MSHSDLFDDDITLVESLLNKFLQDPNLRHLIDKRQDKSPFCSPLEFACKNHRWDIEKLLAPHCSQSQKKEGAPSALHFTVLSLIKHSNSTTISGSAKEVALIKLTDLLRLLLQGKGIDVNATCNLQKSLIDGLATTGGAFSFSVKVFEYVTALHLAALFGCDIAVDELLKVESIDTNIKTDASGGSIYGLNAAYVLAKQGFDLSEINFILDKKRKYDHIRERLGNFKSTQSSTSSASGPTMAPMFTATASSSSSTDDSKEGEDEHYQNDLLRKLFELHWDDKFAEEGPYSDMSKQDALIQFIQSYPRNPSGWSVLANALPLNDSLNIL